MDGTNEDETGTSHHDTGNETLVKQPGKAPFQWFSSSREEDDKGGRNVSASKVTETLDEVESRTDTDETQSSISVYCNLHFLSKIGMAAFFFIIMVVTLTLLIENGKLSRDLQHAISQRNEAREELAFVQEKLFDFQQNLFKFANQTLV